MLANNNTLNDKKSIEIKCQWPVLLNKLSGNNQQYAKLKREKL